MVLAMGCHKMISFIGGPEKNGLCACARLLFTELFRQSHIIAASGKHFGKLKLPINKN